MNRGRSDAADQLTLLVFKDNFAARTFRVPMRWVSGIGLLLGLGAITTASAILLAGKYYRIASRSSQGHALDLEREIADLKKSNESLTEKLATANAAAASATQSRPEGSVPPEAAPPPAQLAPLPVAPVTPLAAGAASEFFSLTPLLRTVPSVPDPAGLAIRLAQRQASWQGRTLLVRFNIQYVKGDGGNQQGRILLFAKGPETLLAYPDGALGSGKQPTLVDPSRGEFFSVSRIRAVEADFGPADSRSAIQEVEAQIWGSDNQLLLVEKLPIAVATSRPAAIKREEAPQALPSESSPESAAPPIQAPTSGETGADSVPAMPEAISQ